MKLTIALCTYNPKQELILRTVRSIVGQLSELDAEFIVIDNNSQPPLAEAGYLSGFPLRIVREPKQGLTAAREAAIRESRAEVILFVDDDNILADGYLHGVLGAFEDSSIGILGGRIMPEYEVSPPGWFGAFEEMLAIRRHPAGCVIDVVAPPFSQFFPVGAGFSIRHDLAVDYVKSTDEADRIEGRKGASLSSGEDVDMCLFALYRGYKLQIRGDLQLDHVIPQGRLEEAYVARLAVSGLVSAAQLERKWRGIFKAPICPIFQIPGLNTRLRMLVLAALSPLSPKYRIKFKIYNSLASLRPTLATVSPA